MLAFVHSDTSREVHRFADFFVRTKEKSCRGGSPIIGEGFKNEVKARVLK